MQKLNKIILLVFLAGCTASQSPQSAITSQDQTIASSDLTQINHERISLYWEQTTEPHPERKPWSDALISEIEKNFLVLSNAQDTERFCPKFKSLNKNQKIKAIGELFVAIAKHESGFNPKSESVDVGERSDKNSWSVGLFQMSGYDSSAKLFQADYEKLKDPVINIKVAVEQMRKQIVNEKLFILPNRNRYRYWAVILDGNGYQKINDIINRVQKNAEGCK